MITLEDGVRIRDTIKGEIMAYSGKVLVVDDDKNVLELVKLYGEREGFNVIGVTDGNLALAAFDRENPDVVILDIMLPGVDGLTLCRSLRAIRMVHIIMYQNLSAQESWLPELKQ